MIAEDREHAVRRVQRRQQLGDRSDEVAITIRDVVAAEDDDVGICADRASSTARATSSAGTMAL